MISFNWKRNDDNEPLAQIRVTWTLSREQLTNLLCAYLKDTPEAGDHELSRAEVERFIRAQLKTNAEARHSWRHREEHDGEPSDDEMFEWAQKQVAKL